MAQADLLLLGALAGFTIFLGLPIARMRSVTASAKDILNSASAGILLFILIEAAEHAFGPTEEAVLGALTGASSSLDGILFPLALAGGFSLGLLGLVYFEGWYMRTFAPGRKSEIRKAHALALMIAIGIGLHNFSEGLAIGQSYSSGALSLAMLLVVGFALHNATEGFGIAAPLAGLRPGWGTLILLGIIGGGPTLFGTVAGSYWVSPLASVLFLSLAAGAILYVIKELLFYGGVRNKGIAPMAALCAGFLAGFATELIIKYAAGA